MFKKSLVLLVCFSFGFSVHSGMTEDQRYDLVENRISFIRNYIIPGIQKVELVVFKKNLAKALNNQKNSYHTPFQITGFCDLIEPLLNSDSETLGCPDHDILDKLGSAVVSFRAAKERGKVEGTVLFHDLTAAVFFSNGYIEYPGLINLVVTEYLILRFMAFEAICQPDIFSDECLENFLHIFYEDYMEPLWDAFTVTYSPSALMFTTNHYSSSIYAMLNALLIGESTPASS